MGQTVEQSKNFQGSSLWDIPLGKESVGQVPGKTDGFRVSTDASLFSSSLPVIFHGKLNLNESEDYNGKSVEGTSCQSKPPENNEEDPLDSLQDMESQTIGYLLPDDEDDLLSGIMDDFDKTGRSAAVEETEEYDLFSSGGGMELDTDSHDHITANFSNAMPADLYSGGAIGHHGISNVPGTVVGEHPYGEHPSRTLFVRNINSNVEDSELRSLFEQYGDIRTLYTACKHRGFVMISYYDIRSARIAMRALQNKPLRRRKLDIHFSIPKDNPSDKDMNQGTLVVFNLDPSVSNEDLRKIFGEYGEVKEIRETPHKRHHKFIEFYDVRAAEAALRALNKSDIAGKRIKLEPSRPGGARRSMMQHLSQEVEQDDSRMYQPQVGSPLMNSPPGPWEYYSSPSENGSLPTMMSHGFPSINHPANRQVVGVGASLPPLHAARAGTIGCDLGRKQIEKTSSINNFGKSSQFNHSHSFPENDSSLMQMMQYNPSATVPIPQSTAPFGPQEGFAATSSGGSFGHQSPVSGISSAISGNNQYLWRSPSPYGHHVGWPRPPMGNALSTSGSQPYSGRQGPFVNSITSHPHHVGSAPSGEPSLERHFGYLAEQSDLPFPSPNSLGSMNCNPGSPVINFGAHGILNHGGISIANGIDCGSPIGVMSPQRRGRMYSGGFAGSMVPFSEGFNDRARGRRGDNSASQADNKKQYQLDLDKIMNGEDTRTTIMIKNIPNKYTSKMLLATIDEHHRGTYDFLYLPIDFKNKCNVGYAFINMTAPSHIISFYKAFNGKKWEKFNSEKVASLAYARIQGKAALIAHFQNSSLMNEDKRCRPILFQPGGTGDSETIPMGLDVKINSMDSTTDANTHESSVAKADDSTVKSDKNPTEADLYDELTSEISKLLNHS
eukprot:TRINITY_DN4227_c0_g1_i3.p1 TRINITY_DN4227_c0_g1~~TRINITY_DN4227_c0_g1_i3.p1  ORF type:complete len:894 (+),score=174.99 TRINITY_DN4227_c0_g1_i3:400-3081(+)